MPRHVRARLVLVLLAVLVPALAVAAEQRVSGTVVRVDPAGGVLVVEELTASTGPEPTPAQRRFALAENTTVALVHRSPDAPGGWPNAYTATPLKVDELRPGDFVTVMFVPDGERLLARLVSVVRPAPGGGEARR